MKSIAVEPVIAKLIPVEPAPVKPAVESAKSATVKAPKSAAVETSASAMRPGVGKIWLAERGGAQESSCGCQNLCRPWPGPMSNEAGKMKVEPSIIASILMLFVAKVA